METVVNTMTTELQIGEFWEKFYRNHATAHEVTNALFQAVSREEQRDQHVETLALVNQVMYAANAQIQQGDLERAGKLIKDIFSFYTIRHLAEVFIYHLQWEDVNTGYHSTMFNIFDGLSYTDQIITGEYRPT